MSLIIKYGESLTREVLAAVPEDLLSSLVAQSLPSSSSSVSVVGSLLHLALKHHCQVPVIELLSGLHPNAAKVTDAKGRLPLALAIEVTYCTRITRHSVAQSASHALLLLIFLRSLWLIFLSIYHV